MELELSKPQIRANLVTILKALHINYYIGSLCKDTSWQFWSVKDFQNVGKLDGLGFESTNKLSFCPSLHRHCIICIK